MGKFFVCVWVIWVACSECRDWRLYGEKKHVVVVVGGGVIQGKQTKECKKMGKIMFCILIKISKNILNKARFLKNRELKGTLIEPWGIPIMG